MLCGRFITASRQAWLAICVKLGNCTLQLSCVCHVSTYDDVRFICIYLGRKLLGSISLCKKGNEIPTQLKRRTKHLKNSVNCKRVLQQTSHHARSSLAAFEVFFWDEQLADIHISVQIKWLRSIWPVCNHKVKSGGMRWESEEVRNKGNQNVPTIFEACLLFQSTRVRVLAGCWSVVNCLETAGQDFVLLVRHKHNDVPRSKT